MSGRPARSSSIREDRKVTFVGVSDPPTESGRTLPAGVPDLSL